MTNSNKRNSTGQNHDKTALFIKPTPFIDSLNPEIIAFARSHTRAMSSDKEKAIALFYAVRDNFRYDPYHIDLSVEGLKASTTLKNNYGWCVSKAILLTAACRSTGIPARLGFADVRNHLVSERMLAFLKTDIAYWHGYSLIYLDKKWIKATPAFNLELCKKSGWFPVEFDGDSDAVFPAKAINGHPHMEYLHDHGSFTDVPLDKIIETYRKKYTHIIGSWK